MRACHSFGRGVVVGWEGEPHHPLHPAQPTHRSPAPLSLLLPPFPAVWLFATTWCHVLGLTPPRMHKLQDALPPLPPSKKTSEVASLFYALLGLGVGSGGGWGGIRVPANTSPCGMRSTDPYHKGSPCELRQVSIRPFCMDFGFRAS